MMAPSWNVLALSAVLFVLGGYAVARHGVERGLLGIGLMLQASVLVWAAAPPTTSSRVGAAATVIVSGALLGVGLRIARSTRDSVSNDRTANAPPGDR